MRKVASWRRAYVSFIFDAIKKLKLPHEVGCTATMYTHRFYMSHTMQQNEKMVIAMAAIYLACKSENHPRSLNDVLIASFKIKYLKDAQMCQMLQDEQQKQWLRDLVLKAERCLLYTTGFRFTVVHPYGKFLELVTKFKLDSFHRPHGGGTLSQVAANFLNDSYKTTVHLRYPPVFIAVGALYTAIKLARVEVPLIDGQPWYEKAMEVKVEQLEEFNQEMLGMYDQKEVLPPKGAKAAAGAKPAAAKVPAAAASTQPAVATSKPAPAAAIKPAAAPGALQPIAVPPAPLTPAADFAAPLRHERPPTARERSPSEEANGSGKRSPPSAGSAEPSAKRARTSTADGAAAPVQSVPVVVQVSRGNDSGGSGHVGAASSQAAAADEGAAPSAASAPLAAAASQPIQAAAALAQSTADGDAAVAPAPGGAAKARNGTQQTAPPTTAAPQPVLDQSGVISLPWLFAHSAVKVTQRRSVVLVLQSLHDAQQCWLLSVLRSPCGTHCPAPTHSRRGCGCLCCGAARHAETLCPGRLSSSAPSRHALCQLPVHVQCLIELPQTGPLQLVSCLVQQFLLAAQDCAIRKHTGV